MKARILFFSQSGNTLAIAEDIAAGIRDAGDECELADLTTIDPAAPGDYDLLGIGCPVFFYKEPFNVADFMDALPPGDGKHVFVFITHGSVPGVTLESMWKRLADKGYLVLGAHNTYADAFVPFYPHPTLTTGHPDDQDHAEAREFGQKISGINRRVNDGETDLIPEPVKSLEGWWKDEAIMLSQETLAQVIPKLTINMDKCTQCQTCEDACPVGGIGSLEAPPRLQDPCIYCFNCIKACPELAIETDWDMLISMAPANYKRYREALEEAEQRGEFRWLMDPDTLNLDDPIIKQKARELAAKAGKNAASEKGVG